jgi:hypothetical protein
MRLKCAVYADFRVAHLIEMRQPWRISMQMRQFS